MENTFIKRFLIEGLFGYKSLDLRFQDATKILIGENGFGKTSVLNALFYVLNQDYIKLSKINFKSITLEVDDKSFTFTKELLEEYNNITKRTKRETEIYNLIKNSLVASDIETLIPILAKGKKGDLINYFNTRLPNLSVPSFLLSAIVNDVVNDRNRFAVFYDLGLHFKEVSPTKIYYFPTYRRIEEELHNLIASRPKYQQREFFYEEDDEFSDVEQMKIEDSTLIQFGMQDVENRISTITNSISQSSLSGFAKVSGDMLSQLLKIEPEISTIPNFNIEEIKIVLSRAGDNLTLEDKNEIIHQIESGSQAFTNNKYLVYFLDQLLNVYKKQEIFDKAIKDFKDVCNKYLSEKEFLYDESAVKLEVYRKIDGQLIVSNENRLELKQLSSGEKQIISIFSRIYLDPSNNFIVLFDEPELSLSIYWQEKLLPDIVNSGRCKFLLAVTHSPFIFNNELKNYAVGLKEFISNGENNE